MIQLPLALDILIGLAAGGLTGALHFSSLQGNLQLFLSGREDEFLLLDKVVSGYFDAIQLVSWEENRDDERMSETP